MSEFDHTKYQASLDKLIDLAWQELRIFVVDHPNTQAIYIRTYLWLASLMLAFELAFFTDPASFVANIPPLRHDPGFHFYLFALVAALCSFASFTLGVHTLRGRGRHAMPLANFVDLGDRAYADAECLDQEMRTIILKELEQNITDRAAVCTRTAMRLRAMSWLILFSILFAGLSAVSLAG